MEPKSPGSLFRRSESTDGHGSGDGATMRKSNGPFQDAVHITAILGESVVFNCGVDFPADHPVPYVLQWEKKVSVDTVRTPTTPTHTTNMLHVMYRLSLSISNRNPF
ncbi:unnamed protein product [Bemisia tabaci]|uniref:Uncharacterized protein n=1 Tax=Bemisia tabaci TaxID=7038 RepID=A0A9P0A922_BEMTA|nr:unnamed protein product [Bemisia tabaci]